MSCFLRSSFNIIFFVVTYIMPIVCMVVCYGRIGFVLWGKGIQDENAANDLALQRKLIAKRNVSTDHMHM